jgi:hypothetical protein
MAVRNDFTAGEVLAAADLNDTFASKLDLAGGKILQIVRATDSTNRSTTSTTFVDVTGLSVTITPQKEDSAIILITTGRLSSNTSTGTEYRSRVRITDASNTPISGAEFCAEFAAGLSFSGNATIETTMMLLAYATPATTSATTYKTQFRSQSSNTTTGLDGVTVTSQIYAIEVSA